MTTEEENELICSRLLGWAREECYSQYTGLSMGFVWKRGEHDYPGWQTFDDWSSAGLLLDAMQALMQRPDLLAELADKLAEGNLTPAEIRAAALEHSR
jgi:hypothetical protein